MSVQILDHISDYAMASMTSVWLHRLSETEGLPDEIMNAIENAQTAYEEMRSVLEFD